MPQLISVKGLKPFGIGKRETCLPFTLQTVRRILTLTTSFSVVLGIFRICVSCLIVGGMKYKAVQDWLNSILLVFLLQSAMFAVR